MSQRKAWNEAMKNAAGGKNSIPGMHKNSRNRSSRLLRREKARKAVDLSTSSSATDIIVAYRIDALEGGVENLDLEGGELDEEFDELEEIEGESGNGGGKRKKKRGTGRRSIGRKRKAGNSVGGIPRRYKPRTLASILVEESSRSDGVLKQYLDAEARSKNQKVHYPPRKFCPVTGLFGIYTDSKSGIPYANLDALEHLRERSPPWLIGLGGGSTIYHDALKSLRNED